MENIIFYKHLGIYAYTPAALKKFGSLLKHPLEIAESLEQNRWIGQGYKIKIGITKKDTICVDTAEDIERVKKYIKEHLTE